MGTRGQKAQDARRSSRISRKPSARYAARGHDAAVDHGWLAFGLPGVPSSLGKQWGSWDESEPCPPGPRGRTRTRAVLRIRIAAGTEGLCRRG
ncbi:hypothetical protein LZ30DRAFT_718719 [Colletotrichum cereale]|nr:hypothetical protein LZ30DRAFT_718719 [Colletotrichum cereale]